MENTKISIDFKLIILIFLLITIYSFIFYPLEFEGTIELDINNDLINKYIEIYNHNVYYDSISDKFIKNNVSVLNNSTDNNFFKFSGKVKVPLIFFINYD